MSDRPRKCIIVWVDLEAEDDDPWIEVEPDEIGDELVACVLHAAGDLYAPQLGRLVDVEDEGDTDDS